MKIDIHTHIMPEHMPNWVQRFGYGEFIHLEHRNCTACMMKGDKLFRQVEPNCFRAEDRLRDMEATGTDQQVLSTIPVLFNYWAKRKDGLETARFFNDHIANTVASDSKHFIGLGTVPMQDVELAMGELERCRNELHLSGLEIGTNINGHNLGEPSFHPFFEAAERLDMPLFIHPWEMMGEQQMQQYWLPWLVGMPAETTRAICSLIFGGVLQKFSKLRIAFAHGGGSFPYTIGRIEHGYHVRPDLVQTDNTINPRDYFGKFWVDSLVHDPLAFQLLRETITDSRICVGSDYPFPLGEHHPGALVESLDLDKDVRDAFLYRNALAWLGITITDEGLKRLID